MNLTTMARGFRAALLVTSLNAALAQPYVISTLAGGVPPPTPIAAVSASFALPAGVAADSSGNIYFSSDNCVFKIDATGTLTRFAGNARAGYSGDGGPAAGAQLNAPHGLAFDASGNLYIADAGNQLIRKVSPGGTISTIAGNGIAGYSGDNVPATSSQLNNPLGVAVDSSGNIYIADSYNQRVRKVVPAGVISTVAGNGTCCYSGDNIAATSAQLYQPEGVAVDGAGNLYIADFGNYRIRKVTSSGVISTVAGTGSPGFGGDGGSATSAQLQFPWTVASDAAGNLYIADDDRIRKVSGGAINTVAGATTSGFSGDGAAATKALLDQPFGVSVDASGNLYIADTGNNRIRKVPASGLISTIAGNGMRNYSGDNGPAISAQLYNPQAVALDTSGNIYVADYARIRKISPGGTITTLAGNGIPGYFGDNDPATVAQLNQPEDIALDSSGNLYIADSANNRIRKVAPGGAITTFAGNGTAGYFGDNSSAMSAELNDPEGLAVDTSGNVYIADSGNGSIRKVTPGGTITTVAGNGKQGLSGDGGAATGAQMTYPFGVAVDSSGNLYIADFGNSRIRKVTASSGIITTIAGSGIGDSSGNGGQATSAGIDPQGVAVDASGNLYIADYNNLVWKVAPNGIITRIAGNGIDGYSGDGGSATSAQLSDVSGVTVDMSGNVYVADTSNDAVRFLRPVAALLSITTASPLAAGSIGVPYSQPLAAAGGTPPYSWSVAAGALPAGLTLSASGVIGGTPAAAGTSTFTVQAVDSTSLIASRAFTIAVSGPTITTSSPLLQGTVGLSYTQTLVATGGDPPYTWTLASGSLPPGLQLSSAGVITGTPTLPETANFTLQLTDAASSSATQAFTLIVIAAPPLTRSGVFAHIAAGGTPPSTWTTTIYLANTSSNQVAVQLVLHADDGTALTLPMTVTQQDATQPLTAASLNAVINPNATLVVDTGELVPATVTGWVDVLSSGPLSGFAIFGTSSSGLPSQGTSPLQTQFQSTIDLPYDNRAGFITAVALANLSTNAATITATLLDSTGAQLGAQTITLPASGHTSNLIPTLFPATANLQGIVEFQNSAGNLAAIGLRASPQGTFTTVPIIQP